MKTFQIYSESVPPIEPYKSYMERIRDLSETYTLIAPSNFMGRDFVRINSLIERLPPRFIEKPNGRTFYDALRVLYLSEHFDHSYLDIDIELLKTIELNAIPQKKGPGVLVGNGDPKLGLDTWTNYLDKCKMGCRPASLMFSGINTHEIGDGVLIHHFAKGQYFDDESSLRASNNNRYISNR